RPRIRPGSWPCTSPRTAVGPKSARGPPGPVVSWRSSHRNPGARQRCGRLSWSLEKFLLRPLSSLIRLREPSHWRLTQRDVNDDETGRLDCRLLRQNSELGKEHCYQHPSLCRNGPGGCDLGVTLSRSHTRVSRPQRAQAERAVGPGTDARQGRTVPK